MAFNNVLRAALAALVVTPGVVVAAVAPASAATGQEVGYMAAYQISGGRLYQTGDFGNGGFTAQMNIGSLTFPNTAIAPVGSSGYEIAFRGSNNHLWTAGTGGAGDLGLTMKPGTSPSITRLPSGGWQIVYQSSDGHLALTGADGTRVTPPLMAPNTSPSVVQRATPTGVYEIAWQGANNHLWATAPTGFVDLGWTMMPGTSPSVAALPSGGYVIAIQTSNGTLAEVTGPNQGYNIGWAMAPGTSPSVAATPPTPTNPGGGWEVAFHSIDGTLWGDGALLSGRVLDGGSPNGYPMWDGTSPAINSMYLSASVVGAGNLVPGYQIAFQGRNGALWIDQASPAFTTKYKLVQGNLLMGHGDSPSITTLD